MLTIRMILEILTEQKDLESEWSDLNLISSVVIILIKIILNYNLYYLYHSIMIPD